LDCRTGRDKPGNGEDGLYDDLEEPVIASKAKQSICLASHYLHWIASPAWRVRNDDLASFSRHPYDDVAIDLAVCFEAPCMTTMITELYDALKDAGAAEDKARKAAETVAAYENRFSRIETDLTVLKWMFGINLAATLGISMMLLRLQSL
jgi:hypothetical protein